MVRMVILPLTIKQIRSMQRLQAHAPELKAIQQKYKDDKQSLNEEVMKFYRENKVNPAASCLPILLQIPIFISLFFVLQGLREGGLPEVPGLGARLARTSSRTSPRTSTPTGRAGCCSSSTSASQLSSTYFMATTADPRQRYLFMALPFVFIFFVINFPIGLMLYWTTTNLWTVGQGLVTRRLVPKPQPPPKRSSRTPPKDAAASRGRRGGQGDRGRGAARAAKPAGSGQQRVRRRKKKGPRARR